MKCTILGSLFKWLPAPPESKPAVFFRCATRRASRGRPSASCHPNSPRGPCRVVSIICFIFVKKKVLNNIYYLFGCIKRNK